MTNALFILAQSQFRDEEFQKPFDILTKAGHKCSVASIEKQDCAGVLGLRVKPDLTVQEALRREWDAVIVVGGPGSPRLADYPEVLQLVKKACNSGKITASICLGGTVLARAGVLHGRKATVFNADWAVSLLVDYEADYTGKQVEVDGNIITADAPGAAERFGRAILSALR
ncbi:MAG: DJ-1/PfpI family protein [Candidatus Aenigmarchaeota archaeon]|nr:DJ-1/PfpI family protein [Candidatus Aenigmarchaeota archaeon]